MERRDFLKNCVLACGAGAVLSVALAGCKSIYEATSTLDNNRLKLKRTEFTDTEGQQRTFVLLRSEKLEFPIALYKKSHPELADVFTALSTKCTHSGCEVKPNNVSLVCPCHGSEFSNKGAVMNPPAERDLKQYTVTTDNENIFVQL